MLIQITDMSELCEAFIIQDIKANVILSKRGELKRASATWAEVMGRDELKSQ